MVLKQQEFEEVNANVFEQAVSKNVEEVFRLQAALKRLKEKISTIEGESDELEKYEAYVTKIKSVVDQIIAIGLGEDEDEVDYEFIDNSRIRIGDEFVELPEDGSSQEANLKDDSEFACMTLDGEVLCKISESIYLPVTVFDRLYLHQKRGLKWLAGLHHKKSGGIVADEMGLGKTITVLSFFRAMMFSMESGYLTDEDRLEVLIVCPATVISQWKDEAENWIPSLQPIIFHGAFGPFDIGKLLRTNPRKKTRMMITSYDMLRMHIKTIRAHPWSYVVLDEGQKIRNPDAAITLAVKTLRTPHRLILSGSPIQNNLVELWSLMDFVAPGHLGTLPLFIEQIVDPINNSISTCNSSVAYNFASRLRDLITPFICRNMKVECADFLKLPEKTENIILCGLTHAQYHVYVALLNRVGAMPLRNRGNYSGFASSSKNFLGKSCTNRAFVLITMLRKVCNHPDLVLEEKPSDYGFLNRSAKLMIALDILANWEKSGHKVLLFSQTIQMLDILHSNLARVYEESRIARIDGDVSIKRRSRILELFERDSNMFLLLLTTRVGGVGLNLTCADRILIFDPDWNPMTDMQARERSYRIGQRRDVVIYRLIASKTVEEIIYRRQLYKYYLSEKILKDPGVSNYKFLNASAWNTMPPCPSGPNDASGYCKQLEKKLGSLDFEMEIRKIKNDKDVYIRSEDVAKGSANHNPILNTIFANHDVDGVIMHDYMEKSVCADVENKVSLTVDKSFELLKRSHDERDAYDISVPTWTGENGLAAAPVKHKRRQVGAGSATNFKSHLNHLRKTTPGCESNVTTQKTTSAISKHILKYFLRVPDFRAPTGDVIQHFGPLIPESQVDSFKEMLKQMCTLQKYPDGPNYWELKEEFIVLKGRQNEN